MGTQTSKDNGPDLAQGVTLADFGDRQMLRGHVGKKAVLLARVGDEVLAVGAFCTHYQGALAEGIVAGDTVRCPLHHACFSLRTGEALGAPAFSPLARWKVERDGDRIVVREQLEPAEPETLTAGDQPGSVVIIGGGAAGFACAEMLRRRGYAGALTMLSADDDPPCDRPNLSKDYLAGSAPEDWIPLKPQSFYEKNDIALHLGVEVAGIDLAARSVALSDGRVFSCDRLLIATGAEPVHLPIPGADRPHVFTLRAFADSQAIAQKAGSSGSAVVLGSGFIGLEVAAALRERGLDVDVVSLDERPLEKVLGPELGDFIRGLHEDHGVTFHMGTSISEIGADRVTLDDGTHLAAGIVILGVGVRPRTALAEAAGLAADGGIAVNAELETATPGVFAAGDVARWTNPADDAAMRVEHWVVATRQGQVAAENMLGAHRPFADAPFFWSAHYDVSIRYVGHAEGWDRIEVEGDIAARDCAVKYYRDDRLRAVATIGRDRDALECGLRLADPS